MCLALDVGLFYRNVSVSDDIQDDFTVGVFCARCTQFPLSPVHTSNNVEATFDFVERMKFQRKTRSTLLPFLATMSNVASTLLLVWTGLYALRNYQQLYLILIRAGKERKVP